MIVSRIFRLLAVGVFTTVLSGCLAAVAVPLATTAAVTTASNQSVDRTVSYAGKASRMSCSQLRTEYAKLQRNAVAKANPLSGWTGRRAAIVNAASQRGCRL